MNFSSIKMMTCTSYSDITMLYRHKRLRYINKGVGRRKIGHAEAKKVKEKQTREVEGTRG